MGLCFSEHDRELATLFLIILNDDGWSYLVICMCFLISPSMKCSSQVLLLSDPLLLFHGLSLAPDDATWAAWGHFISTCHLHALVNLLAYSEKGGDAK